MKTLKQDELYQNLQEFLHKKGVELKDGSYSQKIQKGCSLLSDAINTSQKGLTRAKDEIDRKLDQLRQVIHEKTAPRGAASQPPRSETASAQSQGAAAKANSGGKTTPKPKQPRTRKKH
jgi:hypothetical protein